MDIDLKILHSNTTDQIDISGEYDIPNHYYENSDIIKMEPVKVEGKIIKEEDLDKIEASIEGKVWIEDAISLEKIEYPYRIEYKEEIDENCKKDENTLDIFQFLWENILLEVPLRFTRVNDLSKFHGDGWKLISEDELIARNNPFRDLLKDYDKE